MPNGSIPVPIRENGAVPHPDPCREIPNFTRFAETNSFYLQDSTAHLAGGPELPVEPAFVLPKGKEQICGQPWRPSSRKIVVALPALEASRPAMRSLDCRMPVPATLIVRPEASSLAKVDPQQLLAGTPLDVVSLFLGILETSAQGREPLFVDLPADALQSQWRAILAPFPESDRLAAAWQQRTSYCSTPDPIAAGGESRMRAQEPLPYSPGCIKADHAGNTRLPAPYTANGSYSSIQWPEADSALVPVASESSLVFIGSTMLPHAANVPPGSLRRGAGDPALPWEPRHAASAAPRVVKFLPIREGAILPSARSWERLEAVPR